MKKNFSKLNFLAFALFLCYSCQNSTSNTENTVAQDSMAIKTNSAETLATTESTGEDTTTIYRCDGFRPNVASEWLSVKSSKIPPKLVEIWYWNTVDEKKVQFEIVSQDFKEGDFSGYIGKLRSDNDTTTKTFGLVDEHFNIGFGEEGQEFVEQKTIK